MSTPPRPERSDRCASSSCRCGGGPSRREFLWSAGLAAASLALPRTPAFAGPFAAADFDSLVPRDKKLRPEWLAALPLRGEPEIWRGKDLEFIGMPVGGIACGQLYLGGDGRLWYWDLFNSRTTTDYDGRVWAGLKYEKPSAPVSSVEQGFAIRVRGAGDPIARALDRRGFRDVSFRGEYPIGRVTYGDADVPVEVKLEAFSPFIPLDVDASSIPATILDFTVRNKGAAPIEVDIAGWLENAVFSGAAPHPSLERRTSVVRDADATSLVSTGELKRVGTEQRPDTLPSDAPPLPAPEEIPGRGSMALSLAGPGRIAAAADLAGALEPPQLFEKLDAGGDTAARPLGQKLVGALGKKLDLAPGAVGRATFVLSWWFPHYGKVSGEMSVIAGIEKAKRRYAARFSDAHAVARHVLENHERLAGGTRLWNRTWYDSTLPWWFLDRTLVTVDGLATQTLHALDSGRWWGWEGVDCCPGTCQHVWQYAQAVARLFPQIERDWRERVDFGLAWNESGAMDYRSESSREVAHDGFCGTIIRACREHRMSPDGEFLRRIWPRVKRSLEFLQAQDTDGDGLLEGRQMNTLDAAWFGPMGWISSLYLAAVAAGEAMAVEMGDADFAARCAGILERGRRSLVEKLFDGEYFIHRPPDEKHTNTNRGCHIDQVLGQSFAFQAGLPRVVGEKEARSALRSIWTYSFTPDVGAYREAMKSTLPAGRWYAMPGEGGVIMCTWPKGGADRAAGGGNPTFVGYFNECMTGFEYQVAAHMMWEGMTTEALAITRTIHDRYGASRRNPFNEIECSDHYSRAMMSYGVFIAACGFEHHGPKGHIGFAPRISPEDFRAPFTAAEGWGTIAQARDAGGQKETVEVKWGQLRLRSLGFEAPAGALAASVAASLAGAHREARVSQQGTRILVELAEETTLEPGRPLSIALRWA